MNSFIVRNSISLCLSAAFVLALGVSGSAQEKRKPLFQDITIKPGEVRPRTTPTPGVKKTTSTKPTTRPATAVSPRKTSFPALQTVYIPGYSGILIEREKGGVVMDAYSHHTFNPASNVKVATSYAVLRSYGPNYRFRTGVWTDGTIDRSTKTLIGNLYVSGRDPIFNYEHAVLISNELNRLGVTRVAGDLIVTSNFSMNFSASSQRSAALLLRTMNSIRRTAAANRAWNAYISNTGNLGNLNPTPSIFFEGASYVQPLPSNVTLLFNYESAPLREVVKAMMSYSNNFLSERLGDMVGGAYRVADIVRRDARVAPFEFTLQTCSGLGINRVSPRAQMRLLRVFKNYLQRYRMSFSDVMPVAGLDDGTLRRRFNTGYQLGSLVGKTGTLRQTDRGVSTLSGEITTKQGKFLFVIFNQRGSVGRFRSFQNSFIPLVQGQFGGAMRSKYVPIPMQRRLARSRVTYPTGSRYRGED